MPRYQQMKVMILVKAAPVLTARFEENMCVAGMTLDENPSWVRFHPVPFRDLAADSKFHKYQEVTLDAIRSPQDRRPESWKPIPHTIQTGEILEAGHTGWEKRRVLVSQLGERTACDLWKQNASGSGHSTPSLGVVQVAGKPQLEITKRSGEQIAKWQKRAEKIAATPSLFDDPTKHHPYAMCSWRFRYIYNCMAPACNGHRQTIVDWEIERLWRRVQHKPDANRLMKERFVDTMWAEDRDTRLFIGNMHQQPQSFLVLGVFYPYRSAHTAQSLF